MLEFLRGTSGQIGAPVRATRRGRIEMTSAVQQQVAQAVRDGADLDQVEETIIAPASVDDEEKAALWLYAHALLARPRIIRKPLLVKD